MLREATEAEFKVLHGCAPPAIWDSRIAYDDSGNAVAVASLMWWFEGQIGRPWLQLQPGGPSTSLSVVHRLARWALGYVAAIGEPAIWTFSDPRRPEQERYLRRLGFVLDPNVRGPFDFVTWRKDLACTGPLN